MVAKLLFICICVTMFSCIPAPVEIYRIEIITPWRDSSPIVNIHYNDNSDTTGYSSLYPNSLITVKKIQL